MLCAGLFWTGAMITQPLLRPTMLIFLLAGLAACSWNSPSATRTVPPAQLTPDDIGGRAAQFALWQRGTPYRYGGETPNGFDCSGLVFYAYKLAGKRVPRTTADLHRTAMPVERDALRAGDLVFFNIDGKISHVGIYVDHDRFVHAPRSGRTVSVESLNEGFYRRAFLRGGRLP